MHASLARRFLIASPEAPGAPVGSAVPAVSELGAELFALVDRARAAGVNPELELRHAALVFRDRVRAWEAGPGSEPISLSARKPA